MTGFVTRVSLLLFIIIMHFVLTMLDNTTDYFIPCACLSYSCLALLPCLVPSEARSLLGLENHSMASGRISHMHLIPFLLFSATLTTLPGAAASKAVGSLKVNLQGLQKVYGSAELCSPGKSMFARPKMITPS